VPNKLKQAWLDGKATVNGWLAIPSGFSAEVMAQAGWDSVTVDMQHGIQDYHSAVACFQGMAASGVLPMVRVPWNEPGIIGKVLDAGAYGVICPMVNTPDEARRLVSACRYPPAGARSNGPIRAGIGSAYGAAGTYQENANDQVLCIPMIETQEAIDNIDAILDVPGIDAVYIGPSDLGFSMGLKPILDREEPQIIAAYETILAACKRRGIFAGIHTLNPAYSARAYGLGFRMVTVSNDSGLMLGAARAAVARVREEAGKI
jgi:4-hydroxy-2-oxoheptanedioate aldolase